MSAEPCRHCGKHYHARQCSAPNCNATGALTQSTNHACAGLTRWWCAYHFSGGDPALDGNSQAAGSARQEPLPIG